MQICLKSDQRVISRFLKFWLLLPVLIGIMLISTCVPSETMPMFTRKFNLPCERCHTMPPRLTNFGYAFYRAGYRLPSNEVKPYSLANAISFLSEFTAQSSHPGPVSGFDFGGVELNLATAIEKNLSVRGVYVFSSTADTGSGFDEAWVQYNSAPSGAFWSVRAGQIPILSGYQLLGSRQISLSDPILYGSNGPLTGDGIGNFSIGGLERGVEAGYANAGFYGRFSWLNGIDESGEGGISLSGQRGNDFMLQAEYLIGKEGSSVGGFYYSGKNPLLSADYTNSFHRGGLFGTYGKTLVVGRPGIPDIRLELNAGLLWGRDTLDSSGIKADSNGSIIEAAVYLKHRTALSLRYDNVRSGTIFGVPTSEAYTFAITHRPSNYVRFGLEYRKQRQPGADSLLGSMWFFY